MINKIIKVIHSILATFAFYFTLAFMTMSLFKILNPKVDTVSTEETQVVEVQLSEEEMLWNFIRAEFPNDTVAAAIMGNLKAESNLYSKRYENDLEPPYNVSDSLFKEYSQSKNSFITSPYAFGLAQWTGIMNLERLWNYCEDNQLDISSNSAQISFLASDIKEIKPKLWNRFELYTPQYIVTATEDFRQTYEKSICDYNSQMKRATWAKYYYCKYANCTDEEMIMVINAYYDFQIEHQITRLGG